MTKGHQIHNKNWCKCTQIEPKVMFGSFINLFGLYKKYVRFAGNRTYFRVNPTHFL